MNCQQCHAVVPEAARFCPEYGAPVIQIPGDIAKRAEGLAGRLWVLDEVLDWLEQTVRDTRRGTLRHRL